MKIVENPIELMAYLDGLVNIADKYKTEIGFWPPSSLEESISRGRLIAATFARGEEEVLAGFLIFGGVFPNGSIQVVAVEPDHVRRGVGQTLINAIVGKLEAEGYLAISAKPAKDLKAAQDFYQVNQFEVVRTQSGGQARKREIVIRERLLHSPNLLSNLEAPGRPILRPRFEKTSNLWVIDINVFFDLVKAGREQSEIAKGIFTAALDGRVRVAVSSEFSRELKREASGGTHDPLLQLAQSLPKLRINADDRLKPLTDEIHSRVFVTEKPSQADTPQARSDCRHMAECIIGNASAFVTSDGVLIRNRRLIRETWGLDVVALEDFHDALSSTVLQADFQTARGDDFFLKKVDIKTAKEFAAKLGLIDDKASYFQEHATRATGYFTTAQDNNHDVIGLLASITPDALGEPHRLLLIVDHHQPRAELVADTLLNQAVDIIGKSGSNLIKLADIPGQVVTRKIALQAGFSADENQQELSKAALGIPITPSSFPRLVDRLRLSFGGCLSGLLPNRFHEFDELLCSDPERFRAVEKALAPTLIVSNGRTVCIQPIANSYAAELLGTSDQPTFLGQLEGAFRSEKVYVSSGRSKNFFKENQLIIFYESSRTGGRGAIVAAARVDNVVTQKKSETGHKHLKKTVLDSVERFSASEEVTLTGFSSVLRFPRPVPLPKLKRLQAIGTQNLQTTTVIATEAAQNIFDLGWANES